MHREKWQKGVPESPRDSITGISEALAYLAGEADRLGLHNLAGRLRILAAETTIGDRPAQ